MLDLSTAVLCDFAQVRDRLLFVSSGAVSRLYRQELPSPLGLMVGLVIEVPLEDAGMEHRLRAEVINRHGTVLATLDNTFRVSDAGLFPHEVQQVPLVLSITGVRARTWGTHQVRLYLDEDLVRALTLYVVPAAAPQGARTPTQSRVADDEGSLGGTGDEGRPEPAEFPADPEEPAAADREAAEDDEGRRASVSWGEPSEPGPEPDIGLDLDPELDLEIEPSRQPTPAPASAFRSASIAAAPAREEDPTTAAVPQVFDFDDEDEEGSAKREAEGAPQDSSRFSFRYRYEDDEG